MFSSARYVCSVLVVLVLGFHYCTGQTPTTPKYVRIVTTVNTEVVGRVISENANEILVRTDDGFEVVVYRSNIVSVTYGTSDTPPPSSSPFSSSRLLSQQFSSFGVTLGTPAGLNFRYGYHDKDFAFHAMGGYLGEMYGFQLSPMLTLSSNERTYLYFTGMFGYSYLVSNETFRRITVPVGREWAYVGGGLTLFSRGFILEGGLTAGHGDYSTPQLTFQIGYMFPFY